MIDETKDLRPAVENGENNFLPGCSIGGLGINEYRFDGLVGPREALAAAVVSYATVMEEVGVAPRAIEGNRLIDIAQTYQSGGPWASAIAESFLFNTALCPGIKPEAIVKDLVVPQETIDFLERSPVVGAIFEMITSPAAEKEYIRGLWDTPESECLSVYDHSWPAAFDTPENWRAFFKHVLVAGSTCLATKPILDCMAPGWQSADIDRAHGRRRTSQPKNVAVNAEIATLNQIFFALRDVDVCPRSPEVLWTVAKLAETKVNQLIGNIPLLKAQRMQQTHRGWNADPSRETGRFLQTDSIGNLLLRDGWETQAYLLGQAHRVANEVASITARIFHSAEPSNDALILLNLLFTRTTRLETPFLRSNLDHLKIYAEELKTRQPSRASALCLSMAICCPGTQSRLRIQNTFGCPPYLLDTFSDARPFVGFTLGLVPKTDFDKYVDKLDADKIDRMKNDLVEGIGQLRDYLRDDKAVRDSIRQVFELIINADYSYLESKYDAKIAYKLRPHTVVKSAARPSNILAQQREDGQFAADLLASGSVEICDRSKDRSFTIQGLSSHRSKRGNLQFQCCYSTGRPFLASVHSVRTLLAQDIYFCKPRLNDTLPEVTPGSSDCGRR